MDIMESVLTLVLGDTIIITLVWRIEGTWSSDQDMTLAISEQEIKSLTKVRSL